MNTTWSLSCLISCSGVWQWVEPLVTKMLPTLMKSALMMGVGTGWHPPQVWIGRRAQCRAASSTSSAPAQYSECCEARFGEIWLGCNRQISPRATWKDPNGHPPPPLYSTTILRSELCAEKSRSGQIHLRSTMCTEINSGAFMMTASITSAMRAPGMFA